ncbi:MAG TPA: hypothetical protein VGK46_13025 [Saprospiraceae bacterium]
MNSQAFIRTSQSVLFAFYKRYLPLRINEYYACTWQTNLLKFQSAGEFQSFPVSYYSLLQPNY